MRRSYLRTRPAAQAIQFTVDQTKLKKSVQNPTDPVAASTPATTPSVSTAAASATLAKIAALPSPSPSPPSSGAATPSAPTPVSLDERTVKAAAEDPGFAAALQRQRERELEEAKLLCSIENKEACLMCSG